MRRRHLVTSLALSTLLAGSLAVGAPPAGAAPEAPNLDDFELVDTGDDLPSRVDQLAGELPKQGVADILAEANRRGPTGADCTSAALDPMTEEPLRKFCFNEGDNETSAWYTQGITTAADARDDEQVDGKEPMLVSWYDNADDPPKGARVSFLDPETGRYQHVLLAHPRINSNDNASYDAVTTPQESEEGGDGRSIHAGGLVWSGNYLYVPDTDRGVRVFDMRNIFDLGAAENGDTSDQNQVGRQDGTYYGFGYRYVMPQVAEWSNQEGVVDHPPEHQCRESGPQKFSYLATERGSAGNSLITGEYCADQNDENLNGRVARWDLDDTGAPSPDNDGTWRAAEAFRLPKPQVQGAVAAGDDWYLSSTGNGESGPGYLQAAEPADTPTGALVASGTNRQVAAGVEDLSYWADRAELWTVTEYPGKRIMYSLPPTP